MPADLFAFSRAWLFSARACGAPQGESAQRGLPLATIVFLSSRGIGPPASQHWGGRRETRPKGLSWTLAKQLPLSSRPVFLLCLAVFSFVRQPVYLHVVLPLSPGLLVSDREQKGGVGW